MPVFASGNIHQGHEMFGNESWGRQCAFMALNSILYEQISPVSAWTSQTLDAILVNGDRIFLSALRSQLIPDAVALSLSDLPTTDTDQSTPGPRAPVLCDLSLG